MEVYHQASTMLLKFNQMKSFPPDTLNSTIVGFQIYGTREANEASRISHPNYTFNNGYDLRAAVHLQLSQPLPQKNDAPEKPMKLG